MDEITWMFTHLLMHQEIQLARWDVSDSAPGNLEIMLDELKKWKWARSYTVEELQLLLAKMLLNQAKTEDRIKQLEADIAIIKESLLQLKEALVATF